MATPQVGYTAMDEPEFMTMNTLGPISTRLAVKQSSGFSFDNDPPADSTVDGVDLQFRGSSSHVDGVTLGKLTAPHGSTHSEVDGIMLSPPGQSAVDAEEISPSRNLFRSSIEDVDTVERSRLASNRILHTADDEYINVGERNDTDAEGADSASHAAGVDLGGTPVVYKAADNANVAVATLQDTVDGANVPLATSQDLGDAVNTMYVDARGWRKAPAPDDSAVIYSTVLASEAGPLYDTVQQPEAHTSGERHAAAAETSTEREQGKVEDASDVIYADLTLHHSTSAGKEMVVYAQHAAPSTETSTVAAPDDTQPISPDTNFASEYSQIRHSSSSWGRTTDSSGPAEPTKSIDAAELHCVAVVRHPDEKWGISLKKHGGEYVVSKMVDGLAFSRSGLLAVGATIVSINGTAVGALDKTAIGGLMSQANPCVVEFVAPRVADHSDDASMVTIVRHTSDEKLGLSFAMGDGLQIKAVTPGLAASRYRALQPGVRIEKINGTVIRADMGKDTIARLLAGSATVQLVVQPPADLEGALAPPAATDPTAARHYALPQDSHVMPVKVDPASHYALPQDQATGEVVPTPDTQTVTLHKASVDKWGLSFKMSADGPVISKVAAASVAAASGVLTAGMTVLELNGESVMRAVKADIAQRMHAAGQTLVITVRSSQTVADDDAPTPPDNALPPLPHGATKDATPPPLPTGLADAPTTHAGSTAPTPASAADAHTVVVHKTADERWGLSIAIRRRGPEVVRVTPDSPVQRNGNVRAGQRILHVNDCDVTGMHSKEEVGKCLARSSTELRLLVLDLPESTE